MKTPYPSETLDRVLVRMPDGMKGELQACAQAGYRSMNAEIVARLRRDLDAEKTTTGPQA